jgi:hypothetical protein
MEPTQDQFLYTVQQLGMPEDALYLFAITGSTTTVIQGIALSVFSKPSETATTSEDISDVLEQVERIYFQLVAGENIIVEVLNRGEYLDEDGRSFYYLQITPVTVNLVLTETEIQNIRINFYPYIKGQSFYNSDYNAIQNSINDQEKSTFLQIADRNKLDINPSNLNAILNDFATKAEIPDSNYTSTGWINARYDGVESTETNYGGIPSAISAISFAGSYHPTSLTSTLIRSLSDDEKVIKTYVHTANSRFPSFEINPARLKILSGPAIGPTTGSITYNVYPLNSSIAVNNLLLITGSVGEEIVRITDYDLDSKILYVKRGIGGTAPKTFTTYNIFPIFINRIYELDRNKLNSIEEGKLLVRSTNVILKIDEFGVVYGSET